MGSAYDGWEFESAGLTKSDGKVPQAANVLPADEVV
jgi:hypothetical protein